MFGGGVTSKADLWWKQMLSSKNGRAMLQTFQADGLPNYLAHREERGGRASYIQQHALLLLYCHYCNNLQYCCKEWWRSKDTPRKLELHLTEIFFANQERWNNRSEKKWKCNISYSLIVIFANTVLRIYEKQPYIHRTRPNGGADSFKLTAVIAETYTLVICRCSVC